MKQLILIIIALFHYSFAISQDEFYQSVRQYEELNNYAMEVIAGFLENPYDHDNTCKVHKAIDHIIDVNDHLIKNKFTILSKYDNYIVQTLFNKVEKNQMFVKAFDEYIGSIAGYARGGAQTEFDLIVKPILESFGWEQTVLPVSCPDIVLYEYKKDKFKMVLAYNTRPLPDYTRMIYNDNWVTLYRYYPELKKVDSFCAHVVRGGTYCLMTYHDSNNYDYGTIKKVTSKRTDH